MHRPEVNAESASCFLNKLLTAILLINSSTEDVKGLKLNYFKINPTFLDL